jgi:hypothetical protein
MGNDIGYAQGQSPAGGYTNSQKPAPLYSKQAGSTSVGQGQPSSNLITDVFFHMYLGTYDITSGKSTDDFIEWYITGKNVKGSVLNRWEMLGINLHVIIDGSNIKKARKDLTASLFSKNALVIYIGHTIPLVDKRTNKLIEAPLNPCRVKVTKDNKYLAHVIRNKELTKLINHKQYAATAFLIASCSSQQSIGTIANKKKTVITTDSGKNFTTPVYFFARALEVFLDNILGYQLVDTSKQYRPMQEAIPITTTSVKVAIEKANAVFTDAKIVDKFVFSSGTGDMKVV